MELTIDKFGRVLIPKAIRKLVGLEPGSELRLDILEEGDRRAIALTPTHSEPLLVREGKILVYTGDLDGSADTTEWIKEDRRARIDRLSGLDYE